MNYGNAALRLEPSPPPLAAPAPVTFPSLDATAAPDGTGPLTIFEVPLPKARPAGVLGRLKPFLQKLGGMQLMPGKTRRMRVSETVNLGEKRFVSLVEIDGVSLLIGGGSGNVQLLTQLDEGTSARSFQSELEGAWRKRESA